MFQAFDGICRRRAAGGTVLEVGATPTDDTLLFLPALAAEPRRVGINLDGPHRYRDVDIVKGDANAMTCFQDAEFDTVLCNATLEHDPRFWLTLAEIRRVTRPGGLIVIGVPGFAVLPSDSLLRRLSRIPGFSWCVGAPRAGLRLSTLTFRVHNHPGDYYRFSEQAVREVFCGGCRDVAVETLMVPPRVIGSGIRV
jgi:SAM-dependent methyltransferase